MKRSMIWTGMLFMVLAMMATSCGKKQHITLSKASLTYTYSGGNDVFRIEADCGWEISGMTDWITVNPASGNGDGNVVVTVRRNNGSQDRNATLSVISDNGRVKKDISIFQVRANINDITRKVWFTLSDERWDTDYFNHVIPESYRIYSYYSNEGFDNWFFYFLEDGTGYQYHTKDGDTIVYPYTFVFYPDVDSLSISFDMIGDTVQKENYYTIIHQLNSEYFVFSHAYRPHQFEKITTANVTGGQKEDFKVNPKKIKAKPKGPLIPVK